MGESKGVFLESLELLGCGLFPLLRCFFSPKATITGRCAAAMHCSCACGLLVCVLFGRFSFLLSFHFISLILFSWCTVSGMILTICLYYSGHFYPYSSVFSGLFHCFSLLWFRVLFA